MVPYERVRDIHTRIRRHAPPDPPVTKPRQHRAGHVRACYDDAGNITQRTFEHRPNDPTEDYQYDTLHRLTRTDFGHREDNNEIPHEAFIYDLLGNHLTQDHDGTLIVGEFNDVNEQTDRDSETLTWDLRGNLTEDAPGSGAGQQYAYDQSNMLTEVKDDQNNVIAEYAYDALGRRIEKVSHTPA